MLLCFCFSFRGSVCLFYPYFRFFAFFSVREAVVFSSCLSRRPLTYGTFSFWIQNTKSFFELAGNSCSCGER